MRKLKQPSKTAPQNKSTGSEFTSVFYQTVKEDLTPILLKLFQKIEEATLPQSFYEAKIILIPKPDNENMRKENYISVFLMNTD